MGGRYYVPYSISQEEIRFSAYVDVDYSEPLAEAIGKEFHEVQYNTVDPQTVKIAGSGKVRHEVFGFLPQPLGVDYGELVTAVDKSIYTFADAMTEVKFCEQHRNINPQWRVGTVVQVENRNNWCMVGRQEQRAGRGEFRWLTFLYGRIWRQWDGGCAYLLVKKSGRPQGRGRKMSNKEAKYE